MVLEGVINSDAGVLTPDATSELKPDLDLEPSRSFFLWIKALIPFKLSLRAKLGVGEDVPDTVIDGWREIVFRRVLTASLSELKDKPDKARDRILDGRGVASISSSEKLEEEDGPRGMMEGRSRVDSFAGEIGLFALELSLVLVDPSPEPEGVPKVVSGGVWNSRKLRSRNGSFGVGIARDLPLISYKGGAVGAFPFSSAKGEWITPSRSESESESGRVSGGKDMGVGEVGGEVI
jgi:hypothetical protein